MRAVAVPADDEGTTARPRLELYVGVTMVTKSDRVKISLDPEKKRKEALRKREQKKRKKLLGKAPSVARPPAQQVTITRDPQIAAARKRKEVLRKRNQRTRKQGTRGTLQGGAHE